ncbi:MAG: hypothetical protein HYV07_09175 [Deltaproteobacteria bacterium]|nr:hypothetical protein [Deltaproteobacteria bacterium]
MATRQRAGYKAGDEIDARCTRCKLILAHTIVAMDGEKIAKVRCNTCQGEHVYRPPPSASEATAMKRRAAKKTAAEEASKTRTDASEFAMLVKGKDLSKSSKYSTQMQLSIDDIVDHPKFGVGLVTELREGNKAHVAFPDGGRVLVYNR